MLSQSELSEGTTRAGVDARDPVEIVRLWLNRYLSSSFVSLPALSSISLSLSALALSPVSLLPHYFSLNSTGALAVRPPPPPRLARSSSLTLCTSSYCSARPHRSAHFSLPPPLLPHPLVLIAPRYPWIPSVNTHLYVSFFCVFFTNAFCQSFLFQQHVLPSGVFVSAGPALLAVRYSHHVIRAGVVWARDLVGQQRWQPLWYTFSPLFSSFTTLPHAVYPCVSCV